MEIVPSTPVRRPRRTGRAVFGAVAAMLVLIGVVAALPVFLGMERVAMPDDSMGHALPRGSYVLVERVPGDELEPGDLVSFRDPVGDGSVIRRVTSLNGGWLRLDGDVAGTESATTRAVRVRRVVNHVPWVGYPLLVLGSWPAPYLLAGVLGATVLAGLRLSGRRHRRSHLSAGPSGAAATHHGAGLAAASPPPAPHAPAAVR